MRRVSGACSVTCFERTVQTLRFKGIVKVLHGPARGRDVAVDLVAVVLVSAGCEMMRHLADALFQRRGRLEMQLSSDLLERNGVVATVLGLLLPNRSSDAAPELRGHALDQFRKLADRHVQAAITDVEDLALHHLR